MYLRTVLRSIPSRAAMAEMLSPCRCSSRIVITSPRSIIGLPVSRCMNGEMVDDQTMRSAATPRYATPATTGENYFDESGEYLSDADTCIILTGGANLGSRSTARCLL